MSNPNLKAFKFLIHTKKPTKETQRSLRFIEDPLTLFYGTTYILSNIITK